ncbi:Bug family tripartite tricarboxylate transporter substrate binding protein [Ramlibacter lithotrophicus]|nr:tripartite tricarboxylate transporter substrate binding protein [Ramlibacter lithotrophicus]
MALSTRCLHALLAVLLSAGAVPPASAQEYPSRPVRLIVPFPAGGPVDAHARAVQRALAADLGQPVLVENRGGASGTRGAALVARAPADGYTLLVGNATTLAMTPGMRSSMPYHPVEDFTPVIQTVMVDYVLVVSPGVPVRSVGELISHARARPGALSYGSAGIGSAQHLAAELFQAQTGITMAHVPYKGAGALASDLVAGHVHVAFADQATMMPQVRAGRLRVLAVGGARRSPAYPDLPTVAEAGKLPGYEAAAWQGIVGPAGLPSPIVKRLNDAFRRVQADPQVRQRLQAAGLTPVGGSPDEFGTYIRSEIAKWTKVARDIGATVD